LTVDHDPVYLPDLNTLQGEDAWGSQDWATAKCLATALRTALCGEPLARAVPPAQAAQQELLAAALLIASGYMADAILHWWSCQPQAEGGRDEEHDPAGVCVNCNLLQQEKAFGGVVTGNVPCRLRIF
jgi:hypothetical protein